MRADAGTIVEELSHLLDDADIETDPEKIGPRLKDNSWLSPVLAEHISSMVDSSGPSMNVIALITPTSVDQLSACVSILAAAETPMIMLGAGTTNFGQTVPLDGGVVISTHHLNEILSIDEGSITVQPGVTAGRIEKAARETGQALPVITTTHAVATAAGWICGGHVGLGSSTWGSIWDGNVLGAKVLTIGEEPEEIVLDQSTVELVLHAYGTTGALTEITMTLVPASDWVELVVTHPDFDAAAEFVTALSRQRSLRLRVAAAQDPPLTRALTALSDIVSPTDALTLVIVEETQVDDVEAQVTATGGKMTPWRGLGAEGRPTLEFMVYGHRMLWVKKLFADSAFVHCYLDQPHPLAQTHALKEAWGDKVLVELKYMQSPYMADRFGSGIDEPLPAALVCIVDGALDLEAVMASCDSLGILYQNPHTFFLDQKGLFADPARLRAFKDHADPKGLLNPGKFSPATV